MKIEKLYNKLIFQNFFPICQNLTPALNKREGLRRSLVQMCQQIFFPCPQAFQSHFAIPWLRRPLNFFLQTCQNNLLHVFANIGHCLKKKADAVWTCKFSGEFYTIHGGKYYLKSFHIKQKLSPRWVIYYGQILLSVCVKEMPLTAHEPGTNPSQKISLNEIGAGKLDRPEITLLLLFANSCHMWISWFPPPILHPNKSIISQEVP